MTRVPAHPQPFDCDAERANAAIAQLICLLARQAARELCEGATGDEEISPDAAQQFEED